MIPWEKFATPQDAYDWAKLVSGGLVFLVQNTRTKDFMVLQLSSVTMAWHQEALCARGTIVTNYEVQQALAAIRRRLRA